MQSELRGDLRSALSVVPGQLFAGLTVQHDSSFGHQIAVKKILVERVSEAIARRQRSVR